MVRNDDSDNGVVDFPVVALGASAGGLAALGDFFGAVAVDLGMAYVVVQHLSPDRESELTEILQRRTKMPVQQIRGDATVEPDHIYVIAPDSSLRIHDHVLTPGAVSLDRRRHVSVDHFFESLASACHHNAIGVILSGTRSDGTRGVEAIKEKGGVTFAQSPDEAEYPSMPQSAIDSGRVDLVLPAEEIALRLAHLAPGEFSEAPVEEDQDVFQGILSHVHSVSGHDFTNYKRSTLERRIERRRKLLQVSSQRELLELLRKDDVATRVLFHEMLIGVTRFFRNPEAFEALREKVLSKLIASTGEEPLRIWVPACSTGEEAYTLAILIAEEARRQDVVLDFKVFATDIDSTAIDSARRGIFSATSCKHLDEALLSRYLKPHGDAFRVHQSLRDRLLFAVHDVLKDPPFAKQHLISCRNLLIYLDDKAQRTALKTLHYALRSDGFLFLGASEFLGSSGNLFDTVDSSHRIFSPREVRNLPMLSADFSGLRSLTQLSREPSTSSANDVTIARVHNETLARAYAPPSVLVDEAHEIRHVIGDVRPFLRVAPGRPTKDILKSVQPQLRLQLRTLLMAAFEEQTEACKAPLSVEYDGKPVWIRLRVRYVGASRTQGEGFGLVTFESLEGPSEPPVAEEKEEEDGPKETSLREAVRRLEEEIDQTRQELDLTVERYETAMEELQTSNEELLTINEELQSTTEELETSTEELQSTNEELIAVNDELKHKIDQLDDVNNDLSNLLSATNIGTIFLDREMQLKRFTDPVKKYFNVLESDLGRPLEHLTHRLEYDDLVGDAEKVLESLQPREMMTRAQDGSSYLIRLLPYRTTDDRIDGVVLTFFDITDRQEVLDKLEESEQLFRTVFESASDALFLFRLDDVEEPSTFVEVNDSACRHLGYSHRELTRMNLVDLIEPTSLDPRAYLRNLEETGRAVAEVDLQTRRGVVQQEELNSHRFLLEGKPMVLTLGRDITQRKAYEEGLVLAKEESERLAELRATFLANMSHEIRTPLTSIIGVSQLLSEDELSDSQQEMVQLIRTSGRRLHQTLNSVLDISRIEAGEMVPSFVDVDVVAQVHEDIEVLRPMATQKALTLTLHSPDEGLTFRTDPGFLTRIVYNLVENAIKFTSEGVILVSVEMEGDDLCLRVSDTGIGIPEKFLPRLFEKFKQASTGLHRSFEGSGLGLALVKTLIDMLGGSVEVKSKQDKGSTFTIRLPVPDESTELKEDNS